MTTNSESATRPQKKKYIFIALTAILVIAIIAVLFLFKDKQEDTSPVYGVYRIYGVNREAMAYMAGQDIYFRINGNKTIIYHTTINYKPKFNIKGNFDIDKQTNTLNIKWESGKLPDKITIEKDGSNYFIKIGNTIYKKEIN